VYVGVAHCKDAQTGLPNGGGNGASVTVQVLLTGMLLTVCVGEEAVNVKVVFGPDGEQETVIGNVAVEGGTNEP
jgi:hypothetical protein